MTDSEDADESPHDVAPRRGPRTIEVQGRDAGRRLDRFLKSRFPALPRGLLHKLTRKRSITVNRARAEPATIVDAGDTVELWTDLEPFAEPIAQRARAAESRRENPRFRRTFRPIFEDEHIIALDKPAGVVVHPSKGHHGGDSLLDHLRTWLPEAFHPDSPYRPGFCHRLDQETSGVIVAAKTREAAKAMERALRGREATKTYLALVVGRPLRDEGVIERAIERAGSSGPTRYRGVEEDATRDEARGKAATTHFRVREKFAHAALLELEPEGGRTHQIRVHVAAEGHPVAGDGDYGDRLVNRRLRDRYGLDRLFLHAWRLAFSHPVTGETVTLEAPLARELDAVLAAMRRGG